MFTFRGTSYSFDIPYDTDLYTRLQAEQRRWPAGCTWEDNDRIGRYYNGYVHDPATDAFFTSLITGLHEIRGQEGLSDDEFVELCTAFVQQIPYDEDAGMVPRSPAEVVYENSGDCDEKSLLLIGILAREGYGTALIIFPDEAHAVAGIRVNRTGTGEDCALAGEDGSLYYPVEATMPAYLGETGCRTQPVSSYVYVTSTGEECSLAVKAAAVGGWKKAEQDILAAEKGRLNELKEEIRDIGSSAAAGSYNALVSVYNRGAANYNQEFLIYQTICGMTDDCAGAHALLVANGFL
ncbi:hypothetical protein AZH53_08820 [Methanomicrobiaceae archaeon CYW5]|uniref:hypothetical protein n=1 Tax=Methanovulcanius yangii TaxID=1789227 RepID=UPI0029CA7DAD|nr:hypothetical protein [Methanovulcanius yangii]MBT8508507.1 hypothetical protein [Methanovulcanius yangii]